jgi:uncharacterized protein YqfB (UPF0267 family)
MGDEHNTIEEGTLQRPPRRQPRCSQCNKQGHNISTCPTFDIFHHEAMEYYKKWMHQCIVDYHLHQWQYSPDVIDAIDEPLRTQMNELRSLPYPLGIETILKQGNHWIQTKTRDELKLLVRVYNLTRYTHQYEFTDDELREILHILLLVDADRKIVNGLNLSEVLPYLQYSIICYPLLRNLLNHFFTIPNIDAHHVFLINYLHLYDNTERAEKIKRLHSLSLRSIRSLRNELLSNQGDITRINRELRELRQRRERLQQENLRLTNNRTRIEQRLETYENEFLLFNFLPEDPPVIQFEEKSFESCTTNSLIDCSICLETVNQNNICNLDCNHKFCNSCIIQTMIAKYKTLYNAHADNFRCDCPLCRNEIRKIYGNVNMLFSTLETLCKPCNVSFPDIQKLIGGKINNSTINNQYHHHPFMALMRAAEL